MKIEIQRKMSSKGEKFKGKKKQQQFAWLVSFVLSNRRQPHGSEALNIVLLIGVNTHKGLEY